MPTEEHSSPGWAHLFPKGDFAWAFKMRQADAKEFFSPQDAGGDMLQQKANILSKHPERHLALTRDAAPLIKSAADLLRDLGLPLPPGTHDLQFIATHVEPDLLVMDSRTKSLAAAAVCFPSSWEPARWIGRPIDQIHDVVPRLNPQIGSMIDRFLTQLPQGKSYQRANWSITRTAELNYDPALQRRPLDETLHMNEVFLRLEHQLFTGIPGGIVMGIRIQPVPLALVASHPELRNHLLQKLLTIPEAVARYKNLHRGLPSLIRQMEVLR